MTSAVRMKKKGMERKRRLLTVKKKTMELATLCGVKACTICLGPNGEIETWPEQPTEVKAIIESFKQYRNNNREKKIPQTPSSPSGEFFNLSSAQPSVDETVSVKKDDLRKVLSVWSDDWLHGFSVDGLKDFWALMELKLQEITARIELLNAQNNSQEGGECSALAPFPESNMYEFPLQALGGDSFEMAQGFQQPLQSIEPQTFWGENFELAKSSQQPLQTVEPQTLEGENFEMGHFFEQPLQSVEPQTSVEPVTFGGENFEMATGFQQPLQTVEPIQIPLQTFEGENFEMATGFQQPLQTVEPIQIPLQTFGGENFEMARVFQQPLQSEQPIQFPLQTFGGENFEMAKGFQQPLQSVEPIDYSYSYPDAQTATPIWEAARGGCGNDGVFSYAPMLTADGGQLNYCENVVNMSVPWEFSQTFEVTNLDFMRSQVVDQFNETFGGPALIA